MYDQIVSSRPSSIEYLLLSKYKSFNLQYKLKIQSVIFNSYLISICQYSFYKFILNQANNYFIYKKFEMEKNILFEISLEYRRVKNYLKIYNILFDEQPYFTNCFSNKEKYNVLITT